MHRWSHKMEKNFVINLSHSFSYFSNCKWQRAVQGSQGQIWNRDIQHKSNIYPKCFLFLPFDHPAHSSLHQESLAKLMLLTFVWGKTASGTASSKTEKGLHIWSAPHFCMERDCLWDSEEKNREYTLHSIPYISSCCPRDSLVPYKNEEQISCAVHFLYCSLLSQRQSRPIQK